MPRSWRTSSSTTSSRAASTQPALQSWSRPLTPPMKPSPPGGSRGRRLPAGRRCGGLGADQVDPAGAAGQALFLQAGADADDLDEGDADAAGIGGDVARVGTEDGGDPFLQRQVAGRGEGGQDGFLRPVVDLEVQGGEHVLQRAEHLVELTGRQSGGLAERRDRGGAVPRGAAEQLQCRVQESPAPLGLPLGGGLPGVTAGRSPEPARHWSSLVRPTPDFVLHAVLWRRPPLPYFPVSPL